MSGDTATTKATPVWVLRIRGEVSERSVALSKQRRRLCDVVPCMSVACRVWKNNGRWLCHCELFLSMTSPSLGVVTRTEARNTE